MDKHELTDYTRSSQKKQLYIKREEHMRGRSHRHMKKEACLPGQASQSHLYERHHKLKQ
jgi:hypothetical protein